MMKTRWLAGVLMVVSGVALADRPPPAAGLGIDKLEILLELDAYQKQEMQKILEEQRTAMRAMREKRAQARASGTRPDREAMRAEHEAARQDTRAKLGKVLSEEQLKKFDVLTERPGMRHGRKGSHKPPRAQAG